MPCSEAFPQPIGQLDITAFGLTRAPQRLRNKLFTVFEQVGAELATRAREIMQRVQVEVGS